MECFALDVPLIVGMGSVVSTVDGITPSPFPRPPPRGFYSPSADGKRPRATSLAKAVIEQSASARFVCFVCSARGFLATCRDSDSFRLARPVREIFLVYTDTTAVLVYAQGRCFFGIFFFGGVGVRRQDYSKQKPIPATTTTTFAENS